MNSSAVNFQTCVEEVGKAISSAVPLGESPKWGETKINQSSADYQCVHTPDTYSITGNPGHVYVSMDMMLGNHGPK